MTLYKDKQFTRPRGAPETKVIKQLGFDFPDEETANRFAKAFKHAISLCGGKEDIF
jgi:hypothetical protein